MVSSELALLALAFLLWAVIVSVPWGLALWQSWRAAVAELALAVDDAGEQRARAKHLAELLEQAKLHLAEAEADGRSTIERRADLDAALRGAPPGGRLDAVERVLRDHAARRARRAAEARAAAAGAAAADAGGAGGAGAPDGDGAHA